MLEAHRWPADSSCGSPACRARARARWPRRFAIGWRPFDRVEILDGDEVRLHLSKGLGFSRDDRDTNVRRIGFVARLLARNGTVTVAAAISPYADVRREVRELAERDGVAFVEVHADAELDALAARDVKGLYRKAIAGEIPNFTGVSDPYEAPTNPDVVVRSDRESIEESVSRILAHLEARGLVSGLVNRSVA